MRKNIAYSNHSRYKKIIFLFDTVLILGLLSYAIIFFIINKTLNPADISGGYIAAEQRLFWREAAEKIYALCSVIYILGHVLAIYHAIKQKVQFSLKELAFYFFMQIGIMLICVVPLGILDHIYFFDYVFPLYSTMLITSLLFIVSIFTIRSGKRTFNTD